MILTQEQIGEIAFQTGPIRDRDMCEKLAMEHGGKKKLLWARSPDEMFKIHKAHYGKPNIFFGTHHALCLNASDINPDLPLLKLMRLCGWSIFDEKVIVLSELPTKIHHRNGSFHSTNGPALTYSDGFLVYSVNNRPVPSNQRWIIDKTNISFKEAMSVTNVDLRRIALEKIPHERLMEESNAKLIDQWKDKKTPWKWYELYMLNIGNIQMVMLKMKHPRETGFYLERVPLACTSVKQALAFQMGDPKFIEPTDWA